MNGNRKEASIFSIGTAIALIGMVGTGGVWIGAIASDVDTLKEEADKVEQIAAEVKENTETLIAVSTTQTYIIVEQAKQDKKLDKILDKLEEL